MGSQASGIKIWIARSKAILLYLIDTEVITFCSQIMWLREYVVVVREYGQVAICSTVIINSIQNYGKKACRSSTNDSYCGIYVAFA